MDTKRALQDEFLVLRCQQGSADAFVQLVDRFQPGMMRYASRLLEDGDLALDAVQDTWVCIIERLAGLHDPEAFVTWLFRILRNKCVDRIRKEQRRRALESRLTEREESGSGGAGGGSGPAERLEEAIGELSSEHRSAIQLYYFEGLTVPQIARVESVPAGTVKSRLHYGRTYIRRYLEEREDEQSG